VTSSTSSDVAEALNQCQQCGDALGLRRRRRDLPLAALPYLLQPMHL
jgi:hypothetical protein